MSPETQKLSASLEDYLEAIYNVIADSDVVRSRDISERLEVSKASVTAALKTLAEKKLVNYKAYGYVTLTETGMTLAAQIAAKHDTITTFFADILGIDRVVASKAACKAEHTLGPKIVNRLLAFIEFVTQTNENGYDLAEDFQKFCRQGSAGESFTKPASDAPVKKHLVPLSMISSGQTVLLNNIDSNQILKSRLAAMGMVTNTEIIVIRTDRPGPFIVNVKGSRIALGRGMTHKIMVQRIEK